MIFIIIIYYYYYLLQIYYVASPIAPSTMPFHAIASMPSLLSSTPITQSTGLVNQIFAFIHTIAPQSNATEEKERPCTKGR